jgi:hypothetical protein
MLRTNEFKLVVIVPHVARCRCASGGAAFDLVQVKDSPAHAFGFVILGAVLAIVVQVR